MRAKESTEIVGRRRPSRPREMVPREKVAAANPSIPIDDVLNTLDCDMHRPCDDLVRNETAEAVKRIISRMPGKLREILVLAYFYKLSYAEIAGILGIPVGTVKSRLHTAVGRFAEDWRATMMCETAN